jgi:hypothetical protein
MGHFNFAALSGLLTAPTAKNMTGDVAKLRTRKINRLRRYGSD